MRFSEQVRFSRKWGAVFGVPSWSLMIYGAWAKASTDTLPWPIQMNVAVLLIAFFSCLLFVFGGLGRPLHRWMWFRFFKNSMNPYSGKSYDDENMGLFKLWVGDTEHFEDRP